MDISKMLTMSEVRKILGGRSRSAVYTDIAEGRLPQPLRLGGRIYWHADELDAHLRAMAAAQRAGRDVAANGEGRQA